MRPAKSDIENGGLQMKQNLRSIDDKAESFYQKVLKIMMLEGKMNNKGILGPVISVFVMVLVISILAGLTFLFVAQLKAQVLATAAGGANSTAYIAVNSTENAGATVVTYLPLIFIALIFGAILTLVLRIILPYINLGQQVGGF
jgi:hypothetical protein